MTSGGFFDLTGKRQEKEKLAAQTLKSDFWADTFEAGRISKKLSDLNNEIVNFEKLESEANDLLEIAKADDADKTVNLLDELRNDYNKIITELGKLEFFILFNGKYDRRDVIVSFHAGTGGTEAMDWAAMLSRMLERFTNKHGFTWKVLDEHRGDIVGIKSATVEINGSYAYGWLKGEAGVHRLVRISPFDAEQMRHTSFAMIEVLPKIEEVDEVKIDPKDLRVDTFLASGHGGQSVQTTYSAVRVVHIPTGIAVSCQNERSQLQNKEIAMTILKAKLLIIQQEKLAKERKEIRGEVVSADWGNQIRSYVLQPYKLVKDHRTGYEMQDPDAVLNGDLDAFEEKYLEWLKTPVN